MYVTRGEGITLVSVFFKMRDRYPEGASCRRARTKRFVRGAGVKEGRRHTRTKRIVRVKSGVELKERVSPWVQYQMTVKRIAGIK